MYIPVFVVAQRVATIPWHRLTVLTDTGTNAVLGAQAQAQGLYEFKSVEQNRKEQSSSTGSFSMART